MRTLYRSISPVALNFDACGLLLGRKRYLESRGDFWSGGGLYEQTLSPPILPIQIGPIIDSFASALKKLQVDSGKQNEIKESAENFLLSNKKYGLLTLIRMC
jgi:hypothetical protein